MNMPIEIFLNLTKSAIKVRHMALLKFTLFKDRK